MMPKTLHLEYTENFKPTGHYDADFQLPKVIHTRPSASRILHQEYDNGRLSRLILRSEYDALLDVVIDLDVFGDVGIVRSIFFEEGR